MPYVEAPTELTPSVFLAGGITGCPDWQKRASELLKEWTVLNPRRADFPIDDESAAPAQIKWEFRHLKRADVVMFWFPGGEALQPIALYELGRHAATNPNIVVGAEDGYLRKIDVVEQMKLARPQVPVWDTLDSTCAAAATLLMSL